MSLPASTILYVLNLVSIYLCIPILIAGLLGNVFSVIIFTSLRTFRSNACAFYLLCGTLVNIGQLISGFLTRIMVNGFGMDWTQTSPFYCKFRPWLSQLCCLVSLTCICLATIDQFAATSPRPYWRPMSNRTLAHRLVLIACFLWALHGIPYIITSDIRYGYCAFYNEIFSRYFKQFYFPVLLGAFPLIVMNVFSVLSVQNIQHISRRHIPIIRRELDRQLTKMVLVQVIFVTSMTVPFISHYTYVLNTKFKSPSLELEQQFVAALLNICWQATFSAPFYIFYSSSARFRKQFHYICIQQHLTNYGRRSIHPTAYDLHGHIAVIHNGSADFQRKKRVVFKHRV